MSEKDGTMGQVIQIDEGRIRDHLGEMVRGTVEEALNAMLDAEADALCGAARYERSEGRKDTRAGSYERSLHTKAGDVKLKVPKLRQQTFETAIIERYRRREASVEEALIEMYLAGVSVRRVEDITEALWGTKVSPSTVSKLNQEIYERIEQWRNQPLQGSFPYVFLDGIVLMSTPTSIWTNSPVVFRHFRRSCPVVLIRVLLALLLLWCRDSGESAVFEPVGFTADVHGHRVVQESVEERGGQYRVREDVRPAAEALVRRHDCALACLVAFVDRLKEEGCVGW